MTEKFDVVPFKPNTRRADLLLPPAERNASIITLRGLVAVGAFKSIAKTDNTDSMQLSLQSVGSFADGACKRVFHSCHVPSSRRNPSDDIMTNGFLNGIYKPNEGDNIKGVGHIDGTVETALDSDGVKRVAIRILSQAKPNTFRGCKAIKNGLCTLFKYVLPRVGMLDASQTATPSPSLAPSPSPSSEKKKTVAIDSSSDSDSSFEP